MSSSHSQHLDSKDTVLKFTSHDALEDYLKSHSLPKYAQFYSRDQNIDPKIKIPPAIFALAESLIKAQDHTTLGLNNAFHCQESADYFVSMLMHAPIGFTLYIKPGYYEENLPILNSLKNAFLIGKCQLWPPGFTLVVQSYPMIVDAFSEAFKKGTVSDNFGFSPCFSFSNIHPGKSIHSLNKLMKLIVNTQNNLNIRIGICNTYMDEHLVKKKIKNKIRIDVSDFHIVPHQTRDTLYTSDSIVSIKLSRRYQSSAQIPVLMNLMKVNDTLSIEFGNYFNLPDNSNAEEIHEITESIKPYLEKNRSTADYNVHEKKSLPVIKEFFPDGVSEIILTYVTGEPRKMHQEVIEAFEKDELNIAYLILKRKPSLLDKKVTANGSSLTLAEFIKNRIHQGYNPTKEYDSFMVISRLFNKISQKEIYDLFENLLKEWELPKVPKGNVIVNFVSSLFYGKEKSKVVGGIKNISAKKT